MKDRVIIELMKNGGALEQSHMENGKFITSKGSFEVSVLGHVPLLISILTIGTLLSDGNTTLTTMWVVGKP